MNPELYVLLSLTGLILFLAGFAHLVPSISRWDSAIFKKLYAFTQGDALMAIFRFLWPLGTTAWTVIVLFLLIIANPRLGLLASLALLCAGLLERVTKQRIRRTRPFVALPGISMRQPHLPKDASFPSGDSLRIWFLAVLLLFLVQWSWMVILVVIALSILVSLGRLALGVHYPLDVLAGAGLGTLAAGACLWIAAVYL